MTPDEIRAQLTSNDSDVLQQSHAFTGELLNAEIGRGAAAETRAATTLTAIGVVAGFGVTAMAGFTAESDMTWIGFLGYAVALLFLIRGAYYCLRVCSPMHVFTISPQTIIELQVLSSTESLKTEIAHKLWEYEQRVRPNTAKLFWLARGQRAILMGVALLSMVAVGDYLARRWALVPLQCFEWIASVAPLAGFFLVDPVVERVGLWRTGQNFQLRPRPTAIIQNTSGASSERK